MQLGFLNPGSTRDVLDRSEKQCMVVDGYGRAYFWSTSKPDLLAPLQGVCYGTDGMGNGKIEDLENSSRGM